MSDLGRALHLDSSQWAGIRADQLLSKTMMVVFAYVILAFSRFGVLAFTAPKSSVRLVLLGLYSWLILASLFWLVGRFASPITPGQTPMTQTPMTQTPMTQTPMTQTPMTQTPMTQTPMTQTPMTQTRITWPMALVAVGSTHAPLLGAAIFVAVVAGFAQLQGPGWFAAIVLVGIWMPALVVQAARAITGLKLHHAALLGVGAHLVWLATMGRHVHAQIGHLL